ncbi:unnamed protein product [Arctia plantaginis]|uniref:Fatty acyl-CoA reductase n=1 Tax=Arctia plantaginis TaxID=874455 RepID=A0A8S0ZF59_ARCPL|nr:unnamed protein product [Arctia plantaginis]
MVPRPSPQSAPLPLIPEFYAGREVFITGATGFIGKVLVERLLWTCKEISKLHLLIRRKKDTLPEERLKELKQSPLFDVIRQHCPQQLKKLTVVNGDLTKNSLGLNKDAVQQINQVSVVFHSAATVKFDEVLDVSVEQNLRSVLKVMDICDQLPMIQVMVYVSTAYSNADRPSIEERVYPAPMSLQKLQIILDNLPKHLIRKVTPSLISPKPNTYTFTKAMAESAVAERAQAAKYATAILRPSIVASSVQNPFPGWVQNLNGPSGVMVSAGKGLLHVVYCFKNKKTDMIPVDIAVDTLIAVGWETGIEDLRETRVYNCCSHDNPTTWGEYNERMTRGVHDYPFDSPLWYPFGFCTGNRFILKISQLMLQVAPLHIIDFLYNIFGMKTRPSLTEISDRIQEMSDALAFFMCHDWTFSTNNVRRLKEKLSPTDAATYNLDVHTIDWDDHCVKFVKGVRRYVLQEKDEDIERAHKRVRLLYIIHRALQFVMTFCICRLGLYIVTSIF